MSYVGKKFPSVSVKAMDKMGDVFSVDVLKLAQEKKKKVLLFWYPKDFTFVCPTEIHAFQEAFKQFEDRNTLVLGASCDTAEVHFAWLSTPKDNGGIEGVSFPILADSTRKLASVLDILDYNPSLNAESGDNVSYRATFILDEEGTVFHESINHMPVGRNVHEFIRIIDAYSHVQKHGEVCPANWETGKEAMNASREGVANYLTNH